MNKDTAFSVIVSGFGNMFAMLESEESEPVLNQLLIIFTLRCKISSTASERYYS
jgi:hypothetical protein